MAESAAHVNDWMERRETGNIGNQKKKTVGEKKKKKKHIRPICFARRVPRQSRPAAAIRLALLVSLSALGSGPRDPFLASKTV